MDENQQNGEKKKTRRVMYFNTGNPSINDILYTRMSMYTYWIPNPHDEKERQKRNGDK